VARAHAARVLPAVARPPSDLLRGRRERAPGGRGPPRTGAGDHGPGRGPGRDTDERTSGNGAALLGRAPYRAGRGGRAARRRDGGLTPCPTPGGKAAGRIR